MRIQNKIWDVDVYFINTANSGAGCQNDTLWRNQNKNIQNFDKTDNTAETCEDPSNTQRLLETVEMKISKYRRNKPVEQN